MLNSGLQITIINSLLGPLQEEYLSHRPPTIHVLHCSIPFFVPEWPYFVSPASCWPSASFSPVSRCPLCSLRWSPAVILPRYIASPSPLLFFIWTMISSSQVCTLIQEARLLPLNITPITLLSMTRCTDLSLLSTCLERHQVSTLYLITSRAHLFYILFSDKGSLLFIIWEGLQVHPSPYLFCAGFHSCACNQHKQPVQGSYNLLIVLAFRYICWRGHFQYVYSSFL